MDPNLGRGREAKDIENLNMVNIYFINFSLIKSK